MVSRLGVGAVALLFIGGAAAVPTLAQEGDAPPSQDYVAKAAVGDMFEVQSSRLALQKSGDSKVKQFAGRMIKDHTASSAMLKRIIKSGELPLVPPTKLDDAHERMLADLSSASGGEFDKLYHELQLKAHEEALALHQGYAERGLEPKLKDFAKETSQVVAMHLAMLKGQHAMD